MKDVWAHGVNSKAKLYASLSDPLITLIEADVVGNPPRMAHGVDERTDLTLREFLEHLFDSQKGFKLDFKDPENYRYALQLLNQYSWDCRVFLNADILKGPLGSQPLFDGDGFIRSCLYFGPPNAIISLGWTVGTPKTISDIGYTPEMIDSMLELCQKYHLNNVTFAMHTVHGMASPDAQARLLLFHPDYSITFWGVADSVMLDNLLHRHPRRTLVDTNPPRPGLETVQIWFLRQLGVIRLHEPPFIF